MSNKHEKTEAPTPKRKREARQKGQVARTPELVAWGSILAATGLAKGTVSRGSQLGQTLLAEVTTASAKPSSAGALTVLGHGMTGMFGVIAPLLLGLMAIGIVGNFAQVGFAPSTKAMKPKFERVNPIAGFKRLVSPLSLWQSGKSALKLAALTPLAYHAIASVVPKLVNDGGQDVPGVVAVVAPVMMTFVRNVALAGLALALLDFALQKRKLRNTLRMTKQEVKEEHRQSEGSPETRGRIRQAQMKMSKMRMMAEVGKADVVVVNPTHVAVALRYQPDRGSPRVVAKGMGKIAQRIRAEAESHGIPIVQDVPLARALHKLCDIDQEIPVELYEAVARVLALIFTLKRDGRPSLGMHVLTPG